MIESFLGYSNKTTVSSDPMEIDTSAPERILRLEMLCPPFSLVSKSPKEVIASLK